MWVQLIGDCTLKEVAFYSLLFAVPRFHAGSQHQGPREDQPAQFPSWSAPFTGRTLAKAPRKGAWWLPWPPLPALCTLDPPNAADSSMAPGADLLEFLPTSLAEARMCTVPYCSSEEDRAQAAAAGRGTGLSGPPETRPPSSAAGAAGCSLCSLGEAHVAGNWTSLEQPARSWDRAAFKGTLQPQPSRQEQATSSCSLRRN